MYACMHACIRHAIPQRHGPPPGAGRRGHDDARVRGMAVASAKRGVRLAARTRVSQPGIYMLYIDAFVYIYIYICIYVYMYVCMYVCMYGWMDGWMFVCVYIYTYV